MFFFVITVAVTPYGYDNIVLTMLISEISEHNDIAKTGPTKKHKLSDSQTRCNRGEL